MEEAGSDSDGCLCHRLPLQRKALGAGESVGGGAECADSRHKGDSDPSRLESVGRGTGDAPRQGVGEVPSERDKGGIPAWARAEERATEELN